MQKIIKSLLITMGTLFVTQLLIQGKANAHEPRTVADGALNIVVGWRVEPAFDKFMNAMDFIVTDPIDVDDPQLDVKILYLADDAPDAKIIKSASLEGDLRRDRSNPNRFNIDVLPTKAGAYGFHIMGMVNGMMINEVFICRGGSLNPDGRSFGCIEKPQKFPGGKKSKGDDDD